MKRLTRREFIDRVNKIHNFKYDYSLVLFINTKTKVKIICPTHGIFEQTPDCHLHGQECKKCDNEKRSLTTKEFIEQATIMHSGKYNYEKVAYVNAHTPVIIVCYTHNDFSQMPHHHLEGMGCKKCASEELANTLKLSTYDFINKANTVHNHFYDYSLVKYTNNKTKIQIICPIHEMFEQAPHHHLDGAGCPKCLYKNQTIVGQVLKELNIKYDEQYKLSIEGRKYYIDFYLPDYNLFIEYNGRQHYEPRSFAAMTKAQANARFIIQQERDIKVREYCIKHTINLLEIDGRKYFGESIKKYLQEYFTNEQ